MKELKMLDKHQRELTEVCKWDPNEEGLNPSVAINNTKICHIAKRKVQEIKGEQKILKLGEKGSTLYNVLKSHPMGNLYLFIADQITFDDLLSLTEQGLQANDLYSYGLDGGMGYFNELIATQKMLNELTSTVELEIDGFGKLEMPDEASSLAIDALLGRSKLPDLRSVFEALSTMSQEKAQAKVEIDTILDTAAKQEKELTSMRAEITRLATSARATTKVVIEHDGEIPEGKLEWKKASEVFPSVTFKTDLEVPFWTWDGAHPNVPAVDEHYIFREEYLIRVIYSILTNSRCYLQGHTGTGKTTLVEQVAAALNYPFIRVNFDSEITRTDLMGTQTLTTDEKGRTVSEFLDGILPKAMENPCIALFDEIDFVRPDVGYVLQSALENKALRILEDGDRIVTPHSMFRMFATGNTVGQGDEHGMYQGARPQSLALLDRFKSWIKVEGLNKDERAELIDRVYPALKTDHRDVILQYVTEHLEAFEQSKVLQPMSPRSMLALAEAAFILDDMQLTLRMVILDRASETDFTTLTGIVDRCVK